MSEWKPPKGATLVRHDPYRINEQGMRLDGANRPEHWSPMPDRQIDVAWFDEDEPFVWHVHQGESHPHELGQPSDEAIKAAAAGKPLEGWRPNVTMRPIMDGYVPPQYTLAFDDDPTPKIEPATARAEA
jgi:hypothetical protein